MAKSSKPDVLTPGDTYDTHGGKKSTRSTKKKRKIKGGR